MIPAEFLPKMHHFICNNVIEPDSRTDENLLDFWYVTQFFSEVCYVVSVIYLQIRTRLREQALAVPYTRPYFNCFFAGWLAEVRRRTSNVMDISFKVLFLHHFIRFI